MRLRSSQPAHAATCLTASRTASGPNASTSARLELGAQPRARGDTAAPQHASFDRAGEPLAYAVDELVGGVAVETDDVGDLRGRQTVAQLQVDDLAVAFAERVGGFPQQRGELSVLGDARGVVE